MAVGDQKASQLTGGQSGGTSIICLVTVLAAVLLSSSQVYLAQADLRMTSRQIQARQALYLAEAAVELARSELAGNPAWQPQPGYTLSTGTFTVNVQRNLLGYTVEGSGKTREAWKKIRVNLQPDGLGQYKISSYTEVYN